MSQIKTLASMRSCTKGSKKVSSSLDKFGKIEKTDDYADGISVNTWIKHFRDKQYPPPPPPLIATTKVLWTMKLLWVI